MTQVKTVDALPAGLLPVKVGPDLFAFMIELDQAEWGEPTPSSRHYTTVEELRAHVPSNGTRVWTDFDLPKLERAVQGGRLVIVDFWLASSQTLRHARRDGVEFQQYLDQRVAWLHQLQKQWGDRVWFCICGEQDNGLRWPETAFPSKFDAFRFFRDAHLDNIPNTFSDGPEPGFEPHCVRKMADVPMMRDRYRIDWSKEPVAVQACHCNGAHHYYDWGAGLVWFEHNCYLFNDQVTTAFLRGAARQFGRIWGVDFSTWGDPTRATTHYDAQGRRCGGVSLSLLQRQYLASYYSGANALLSESSASTAWMPTPDGGKTLSPLGQWCRDFGHHTLLNKDKRGRAHAPVALLMEKYHGWNPRDHRVWGGTVPYTRDEQQLDNFFDLAFPGQSQGFYRDDWRKPGCEPRYPVPDRDIEKWRLAVRDGLDTRPLERGYLAASTWGDSFDVLLDDCPLDILPQYPLVVLLGGIRLNAALRLKLESFVRQGGTVLAHCQQVPPDLDAWFGVSCDRARLRHAWSFTSAWDQREYDIGSGQYHPMTPLDDQTKPLITASGRRNVVATQRAIGKGRVIFVSLPYLQHAPDSPFSPVCQALLDHLIQPHLLVDVRGRPIQFVVTDQTDAVTVLVNNNDDRAWSGSVLCQDSTLDPATASDGWTNQPLASASAGDRRLSLSLQPFEWAIIKIPRRR
ncbi:MAG: hypothetical protein WC058_12740 [Phycisphaeraceae bacterium]